MVVLSIFSVSRVILSRPKNSWWVTVLGEESWRHGVFLGGSMFTNPGADRRDQARLVLVLLCDSRGPALSPGGPADGLAHARSTVSPAA
jgi:hypothetical protein